MKMIKLAVLTALLASTVLAQTARHQQNAPDWHFAVSGDSRNCGDVVVPSIAASATKNKAAFYWHLGDLRAIYGIDEDYQASPEHRGKVLQKDEYLKDAWDDFIQNQLAPLALCRSLWALAITRLRLPKHAKSSPPNSPSGLI